jgi:hypothetical protein
MELHRQPCDEVVDLAWRDVFGEGQNATSSTPRDAERQLQEALSGTCQSVSV